MKPRYELPSVSTFSLLVSISPFLWRAAPFSSCKKKEPERDQRTGVFNKLKLLPGDLRYGPWVDRLGTNHVIQAARISYKYVPTPIAIHEAPDVKLS